MWIFLNPRFFKYSHNYCTIFEWNTSCSKTSNKVEWNGVHWLYFITDASLNLPEWSLELNPSSSPLFNRLIVLWVWLKYLSRSYCWLVQGDKQTLSFLCNWISSFFLRIFSNFMEVSTERLKFKIFYFFYLFQLEWPIRHPVRNDYHRKQIICSKQRRKPSPHF